MTSTPVKGLWPIYSKWRSSVLVGDEAPPCKSVRFGVADTIESVEGGNLSGSGITEASGGVEGSDFTSGGFSTLEAIAKKRADERDGGLFELASGMVRVPRVESIVEEERVGTEKSRYYPSQSAKSLLKDFFELKPPTHLAPSHPTTSFRADQMIQFARAVGLEVSLASYGMLEDLLLKARVGDGVQPVGSLIPLGGLRSLVLLDLAGATVSLRGPIIHYQLLLRLMLVILGVVENCYRSHALVDKLMHV